MLAYMIQDYLHICNLLFFFFVFMRQYISSTTVRSVNVNVLPIMNAIINRSILLSELNPPLPD